MTGPTSWSRGDPEPAICLAQMGDAKACLDPDAAIADEPRKGAAERAASGKLVVGTATKSLFRIVAAQNPDQLSSRNRILQLCQVDKRANRRMSASQHGN